MKQIHRIDGYLVPVEMVPRQIKNTGFFVGIAVGLVTMMLIEFLSK